MPEIVKDEVDAVALFLALATQWNWLALPFGGGMIRTGINYSAIVPIAAIAGIVMTPALFLDVQVMEAEALRAFAENRA